MTKENTLWYIENLPESTDAKVRHYFDEKNKYYLNSQKYFECQLVSAINAAIYLTELPILQNSIEYERLVDLTCARSGPAINIEAAHEYLRLISEEIEINWKNIKKHLTKTSMSIGSPVEVAISHHKTGLHSVLIIDYIDYAGPGRDSEVRVLNFACMADGNGWIKWKKFRRYLVKKGIKLASKCRVFKLSPWYLRDLQIHSNQKLLT